MLGHLVLSRFILKSPDPFILKFLGPFRVRTGDPLIKRRGPCGLDDLVGHLDGFIRDA